MPNEISDKKYVLYFYCTLFKNSSAGVQTIYYMIDYFNRNNQEAYILYQNETIGAQGYRKHEKNDNYLAPVLTEKILNDHINQNYIPIAIYPDTVAGNPLGFENICRLLLYYDGVFTKKSCLKNAKNEGVVYFSELIKERASAENVLYDEIVSYPVGNSLNLNYNIDNDNNDDRTEEYYYDGKFTSNFSGIIPDNIKKLKKIDRGLKESYSQEEIFKRLKSAKILHIFEDTALIYEALLLGCPVNIHPKGYFYKNQPLSHNEVNLYGTISKYDVSDNDIAKARKDLKNFYKEFNRWRKSGDLSLKRLKENFFKHKGGYNKKNVEKIKKNIRNSDKYFSELSNIASGKKESSIFGIVTIKLINFFYYNYKITQRQNFFGRKIFKFIGVSIFYHFLPTSIKRKISITIKNK